jgi:hypothetical protein
MKHYTVTDRTINSSVWLTHAAHKLLTSVTPHQCDSLTQPTSYSHQSAHISVTHSRSPQAPHISHPTSVWLTHAAHKLLTSVTTHQCDSLTQPTSYSHQLPHISVTHSRSPQATHISHPTWQQLHLFLSTSNCINPYPANVENIVSS